MAIFLTGSTGYLGSYLVAGLFTDHMRSTQFLGARENEQASPRAAVAIASASLFDFPEFLEYLNSRVRIFRGDLTSERFGLSDEDYRALVDTSRFDSALRCFAESQIREAVPERESSRLAGGDSACSPRAGSSMGCGATRIVSTVAVAGKRQNEVVAGRLLDRLAAFRLRSLRAHEEILPSTWCINCCPMCRTRFSAPQSLWETAAARRPRNLIWCRPSICSARMPILPLRRRRPHRHCTCKLRGRRDREDSSDGNPSLRYLSSFVGHRFADLPGTDRFAGRPRVVGRSRAIGRGLAAHFRAL